MKYRVPRQWLAGLVVLAAAPLAGPSLAYADADGCDPGVRSDFNGDGRSDTVVADPSATVAGLDEAGRIVVLYGDADGRVGEGARDTLWQGKGSLAGVLEAGDRFGSSLAVADIDCDGYTDVVAGSPNEDLGGQSDTGYVQVIWGSGAGLGTGKGSTQFTQATFGQPAVAGDQFGYAVDAVEDVGSGGTPDPDAFVLAIGVPGANVGGDNDAGAIAVVAPYDGGGETYWISQDTPGIVGAAEPGDRFGAAVSCNFLRSIGDTIDCVVGAPNEDVGSKKDAGSATIVEDIYFDDGLGSHSLDQDAPGVPGSSRAGDQYGRSIDTVRVGNDAWIAVGAPGEDVGSAKNAGMVQLFVTDTEELAARTALTQNTSGVSDSAQAGDIFGDQLAWIAPGLGDTRTRLAVSAPKEDLTAGADAGLVQVFPMNTLSSEKTWSQDSAGVPGSADGGDKFGSALAVVAGASERVLLVGVPDDTSNATGMVNVMPFGGTPRFWKPSGAIPTVGAARFGAALGGVSGGSE